MVEFSLAQITVGYCEWQDMRLYGICDNHVLVSYVTAVVTLYANNKTVTYESKQNESNSLDYLSPLSMFVN